MEENNITPDVTEEITTDVQESTEPSAEVTEEQSTEDMTQSVKDYSDFLKIIEENAKYNKEPLKYESFEDAIADLQKGRNYGKLEEKLNSYENNAGYKWLEKYAKQKGFDNLEKFAEAAEAEEKERQHNQLVESYRAKFGAEAAEAMAEMQRKVDELSSDSEKAKKQAQETQEYTDFIKWYNSKKEANIVREDFDPNNIPDEIWDMRQNGMSLKEAYSEYLINNIKTTTEQATLKKIGENAETSTGSIKQDSTTSETGEFTREYIDKMTKGPGGKKWAMDNMDKIEKSGYFN